MSAARRTVPKRKLEYAERLNAYLDKYQKIITIGVDNVGSKTLSLNRKKFRARDIHILMGKNTIIRKVLTMRMERLEKSNPKQAKNAEAMLEMVQGNCGFIFLPQTQSIQKLREEITNEKVQTAAKTGVIAPSDVVVPPGPTGQDPSQTAFFQALNISTKINRGQVEIMSAVRLINKGEKVSRSAAELCVMLNIKPFYYGITVEHVFDNGEVFPADVLDISEADIAASFFRATREVAALCLALHYPTAASAPHSILDAYKNILAVGLACENYSWPNLVKVKEVLADPSKFQAAAAPTDTAPTGTETAPVVEEEEEEESSVAAGGMFGGSGSDSDESSDEDESDS